MQMATRLKIDRDSFNNEMLRGKMKHTHTGVSFDLYTNRKKYAVYLRRTEEMVYINKLDYEDMIRAFKAEEV